MDEAQQAHLYSKLTCTNETAALGTETADGTGTLQPPDEAYRTAALALTAHLA